MKFSSLSRAAIAASFAGLLTACGGGGGDAGGAGGAAPDAPSVAWASPAAFVSSGLASKSFALANCSRYDFDSGSRQNLYNATLKIASSGDISISAATTTTGTVSPIFSIAFSDARSSSWSASGTTQTPTYALSMNQSLRNGNTDLNIYDEGDEEGGAGLSASRYDGSVSPRIYFSIGCDMTARLALQISPDQARAAKNLGTAAGVTTFDSYDAEGRIEGGNAFWFNSNASTDYSNLRFSLGTGELSSSTSTTGTYSPISLTLPSSANASINGFYGEFLSRNDSFFNYKEAKTICLGYRNNVLQKGFDIAATAYGNMFYPVGGGRRSAGPSGFEAPRGISIEGCGGSEE